MSLDRDSSLLAIGRFIKRSVEVHLNSRSWMENFNEQVIILVLHQASKWKK